MSYLPHRPTTRRLTAAAAAAITACAISSAAYAATASPAAHTAPAAHAASVKNAAPGCTDASLRTWVATKLRTESAGVTYYPLEFTNTSRSVCSLSGYPVVSAVSKSGSQLGSPAGHGMQLVAPLVTLAPGQTAHTILAYRGRMVSSGGRCGSVGAAAKLRVNLDGLKGAAYPALSFRACSHAGPVYLTVVEAIRAGTG
jgi:hypothetical protein